MSVPASAAQDHDLVVIGGTPAGIVLAVRAAREGLRVLLVHHTGHLGGMLANGLGVWDTRYERKRAPLYDEVRAAIFAHYRDTYGADSPQYRDALPGASGHSNGKFEPHVAERILTALVERENRITVVRHHHPVAAERAGTLITGVTFARLDGPERFRAGARMFADCSYEADLLPLARIPYRVGRESRAEFGEPHAGELFMRPSDTPPDADAARLGAAQAALRLRSFPGYQVRLPAGTGAADGNVQAMNYRVILTSDPARRRPIPPPARLERDFLRTLEFRAEITGIPNRKLGLNRPQLLGPHHAYVEGDWTVRRQVMDAHWQTALALLWFKQHDPSVSEMERQRWREYGLAGDEFTDHGHRPYEIYVREGRRLQGRVMLTEADTTPAAGIARPPLHSDSIGFTEWYVDAHACTPRRVEGSLEEGKVMLHQETFPGQVPLRALLPEGVVNLIVPVNLSATHVAWNTVRLEPTWMHLAEAAAYAVVQALRAEEPLPEIDRPLLLQTLARRGVQLAFFNDLESAPDDETAAAAQYFSTFGFFPDFDARLDAPLDPGTAREWLRAAAAESPVDPLAVARAVAAAGARAEPPVRRNDFYGSHSDVGAIPLADPTRPDGPITRAEALRALWRLVRSRHPVTTPHRGAP
ncbi:MAG: FAD-dependent oxidoreductase [Opitutaceae bacterium]|nr:FAD-dependent oxidoreductase [Opitutaceae bacterium]